MKKKTSALSPAALTLSAMLPLLLSGCGGEKAKWEKSPGTQGFVNLDAVKDAFQKNLTIDEFEKQVNRIYEGDHLVLLKLDRIQGKRGFIIYAREDLNGNRMYDEKEDDLLFTLTVEDGRATLAGAGVNRYYQNSWVYQPSKEQPPDKNLQNSETRSYHRSSGFWWWYMYGSRGAYTTPYREYDHLHQNRSDFRNTSGFTDQVKNNSNFEQQMATRHGEKFTNSVNNRSAVRQGYITAAAAGKTFRNTRTNSGWAVRAGNSSLKSSFRSASAPKVARSSGSSVRSGGFSGSRGFSGGKV